MTVVARRSPLRGRVLPRAKGGMSALLLLLLHFAVPVRGGGESPAQEAPRPTGRLDSAGEA